ncbi:MAG: flagellar biosynthetic protein FliO [Bryobacterales bacterium]|nr:flagellar biosynthetic protein FliO [Bryobacterales bacterium]
MGWFAQAGAIALVIALAAGARALLGRARGNTFRLIGGDRRRAKVLEVIDRLALSPRHSLYAVRLADQMLVVAVHGDRCSLLKTMRWPGGETKAERPSPAGVR